MYEHGSVCSCTLNIALDMFDDLDGIHGERSVYLMIESSRA